METHCDSTDKAITCPVKINPSNGIQNRYHNSSQTITVPNAKIKLWGDASSQGIIRTDRLIDAAHEEAYHSMASGLSLWNLPNFMKSTDFHEIWQISHVFF